MNKSFIFLILLFTLLFFNLSYCQQNRTRCCSGEPNSAVYSSNVIIDSYIGLAGATTHYDIYSGGVATFDKFKVKVTYMQGGCSCSVETCNAERNQLPNLCQLFVAIVAVDNLRSLPVLTNPYWGIGLNYTTVMVGGMNGGTLLAYDNFFVRSCDPQVTNTLEWELCSDCKYDGRDLSIQQHGGIVLFQSYYCPSHLSTFSKGFYYKGWATYSTGFTKEDN